MSSLTPAIIIATLCLYQSKVLSQDGWLIEQGSPWSFDGKTLRCSGNQGADSRVMYDRPLQANLLLDTKIQFSQESKRCNFGFAFRANTHERLVLRYYDKIESLELLHFHGDDWDRLSQSKTKIKLQPGKWYRLQLIALGSYVSARIWKSGTEAPFWQLHARVEYIRPGQVGVVVHDAGNFSFKEFSCHDDHKLIDQFRKNISDKRKAELEKLRSALKLAVAPESFSIPGTGFRRIEIALFAENDRAVLPGKLTWSISGITNEKSINVSDYIGKRLFLEIAEPFETQTLKVQFSVDDQLTLNAKTEVAPEQLHPYRYYVTRCVDTLLKHGRDHYGPEHSPLMMAVLDTTTLRSPEEPEKLDALVRLEGRLHRRGERGSNLWYDQSLIKAMRQLSEIKNDPRYAIAAKEYTEYFLAKCRKRKDNSHHYHTGLPAWGSHIYWNCFAEKPGGDLDGSGPHEILVFIPDWQFMYSVSPGEVQAIADAVWEHHIVDKETGRHNRHDDGNPGCDFAFSGSSFVQLFASLYKLTGKQRYLDQAKTVAGWHWNNRNKSTNLVADCPGLSSRYDGQHCFTTVAGPHALALLEASRISGDDYFKNAAIGYIKAFDEYGWDENEQSYFAMLKLDGKPVGGQAKGEGYDAYAPYGHVNVWRTTFFSYEFTLAAAQAAITAYELSGNNESSRDPELLAIAKRWATAIENEMPAKTGRRWKAELEQDMPMAKKTGGAYAEDYGRAILFFNQLHRATNDPHYNTVARKLADDAIKKLFHNGLFKGHPAKPYYETTNGVGILLWALLQLEE